jgi:hypothetical protein
MESESIKWINVGAYKVPAWFGIGGAAEFCEESGMSMADFQARLNKGDVGMFFQIIDRAIDYGAEIKKLPRPEGLTRRYIQVYVGWEIGKVSGMIELLFDVPLSEVNEAIEVDSPNVPKANLDSTASPTTSHFMSASQGIRPESLEGSPLASMFVSQRNIGGESTKSSTESAGS